ncbi:MAG: hypothetical protein ABF289_06510, partial [Clostridiales bacterium]
KYNIALKYFINSAKILSKNLNTTNFKKNITYEYINSKIKIIFCYELLQQFDKALEHINDLKHGNFDLLNKLKNDKLKNELKTKIIHILGHIQNESALKNRLSKNTFAGYEIYLARKYLKVSSQTNTIHKVCEGAILAEFNEHNKAVEIYEDLLSNDIKLNIHEKSELYFYLGYSNYCLNKKETGEKYYKLFEDYCIKYNHLDGLLYTQIFKIKLNIYNKKFADITFDEIESWLRKLKLHFPSRHSNIWIISEWYKLNYLLNSYWYIKNILDKNFPLMDVIDDILYHLKKYIEYENLTDSKVSNKFNSTNEAPLTSLREYSFYNIKINSVCNVQNDNSLDLISNNIASYFKNFIDKDLTQIYHEVPNIRENNNLLIYCQKNIFDKYSFDKLKNLIKYNHKDNINYIIFIEDLNKKSQNLIENIKNNNEEKILRKQGTNSTIYFDNFEDTIKTIFILNVYEKIRLSLSEPKFLYLSTIPLTKNYEAYMLEPLETLIDEYPTTEEIAPQLSDIKFIKQLKNIEDWQLFRSNQELKAETGGLLFELFCELTNNILDNTNMNQLAFSCFYSDNFKTNEYRVPFFYNNQFNTQKKFDNRKPYSNTGIEPYLSRIFDIFEMEEKLCEIKPCNNNYDKECKYKYTNTFIHTNKSRDLKCDPSSQDYLVNIHKLIAEIPDDDLIVNRNYSVWLKRIVNKNKTISTAGLFIALFNNIDENSIKNLCNKNNAVHDNFIDKIMNTPTNKFIFSKSYINNNDIVYSKYDTIKNFQILLSSTYRNYNNYKEKKEYADTVNDLDILLKDYKTYLYKIENNIHVDNEILNNAINRIRQIFDKHSLDI